MARVLRDKTLRDAPSPDFRFWRVAGGPTFFGPEERGGYITFDQVSTGQAQHIIPIEKPWDGNGMLIKVVRTANSASTNRLRVWLGHSGAYAGTGGEVATNGFCMTVNADGTTSSQKLISSVSTTISSGSVSGKFPVGVPVFIRAERMEGRVRWRMWAEGTAEPTAWDHDYADDSAVPVGVPAFSNLRSGATMQWKVGDITLYAPVGQLPSPSRPQLYNRKDGSRLPFGRRSTIREDSVVDASLPSWLTGTVTTDLTTGIRSLAAAAGATSSIVGIPASAECHRLTVHNLRLSSDTQAGVSLKFTDGTNTWELRQDLGSSQASLYVNAAATLLPYQIRSNGEGVRHRTVSLLLIPAVRQLIALEGTMVEGQLLGWVDLTSVPARTTALTPSLSLTAGSSARSLEYGGITVELQRL